MRLVSLCPSITETLIDFGLTEALVGVTRYCIRPREVTRKITKVGGTKDPDLDAIAALKPDLIFLNEEENTRETHDALAARYRVDVSFPRSVADVPDMLRHFGRLTAREAAAEARAGELDVALSGLTAGAPCRFAYMVWRDPWMSAGPDTYVSDLFSRAGGINVYETGDRYPETTLDALAASKPELVLLPDEPYKFRQRDADEVHRALGDVRVELVSGDDCCWHGVRSIRGVQLVEKLCRARPIRD